MYPPHLLSQIELQQSISRFPSPPTYIIALFESPKSLALDIIADLSISLNAKIAIIIILASPSDSLPLRGLPLCRCLHQRCKEDIPAKTYSPPFLRGYSDRPTARSIATCNCEIVWLVLDVAPFQAACFSAAWT